MSALVFMCCDSNSRKKHSCGVCSISGEFRLHDLTYTLIHHGSVAPSVGEGMRLGESKCWPEVCPNQLRPAACAHAPPCQAPLCWLRRSLLSPPFLPWGCRGYLGVSSALTLSTGKQLPRGLALGARYAWGQAGRDGRGWIAAFLSLGSAAVGRSFISSGFMDLEGSLELLWSPSSLIGVSCSQHPI